SPNIKFAAGRQTEGVVSRYGTRLNGFASKRLSEIASSFLSRLSKRMDRLSETFLTMSKIGALPIEKSFNYDAYVQFALDNWQIPIGSVVAYMVFCYAGSKIMEKRQAFDLQMPLALWNAFLCVFSFIGMCRTVPYLFHFLTTGQDYHTLICHEGSHF